jgi:flavorubredoxin
MTLQLNQTQMTGTRKAIVIYDTQFGNTEKIAKALASGIKEQGVQVDCVKVDEIDINKLAEYDLLAIGGPTQAFGMSKPVKDLLRKLEGIELRGKKAFAFDTKMSFTFTGSAAKGIEGKLKGLGVSIVRPCSSAIVKGRGGPLEEGAEEAFKQIGAEISGYTQ